MRPRGLLVLSVLALAVGAFIWFVERDLPTTDELEAREDRLFDLEAAEVHRMTLSLPTETVVLERAASIEEESTPFSPAEPWFLVEPLEARAEESAVSGLLNQIIQLETVRTLEGEDAASYGLEAASLAIDLTTNDATVSLVVGDELPASSRRVVRLNDSDRLYVVEAPFVEKASQPAGDWRDPKLFPGGQNDIRSVRLRREGSEILLAKRGDRFWLESPLADLAARDEVAALLTTLTDIEAKRFLDAPSTSLQEMGLERALGQIEVLLEGEEEPVRILWGARAGVSDEVAESSEAAYFAQVNGVLIETEAPLEEPLGRTAGDWRSMAWMTLPTYEVERVTIGGSSPLELVRDGVDWKRGDETIDYSSVNQLLNRLSELRAQTVQDSVGSPGEAQLTLDITAKDGTLTTLGLHRSVDSATDGGLVATTSERAVQLNFEAQTWADLNALIEAVRSAEPMAKGIAEQAPSASDSEADAP